jgi:hypothetical protein
MRLLNRLEKRLSQYALPNITLWLLIGQVMVFFAQYVGPLADNGLGLRMAEKLSLIPEEVIAGEWWRLMTFPFLSSLAQWPVLILFYFYFFYLIGTTLEGVWGSFRLNVFLLLGYVATVAAAFLVEVIQPGAGAFTYEYVYGSMFLAFARLFPDFEMLLFFILPMKIKWMARLQWAFYLFTLIVGTWPMRLMVLAAVFNFLVFFGRDIWRDAKYGHRRMQHKAKTLKAPAKVAHECRVCGLTSAMAPKASFRYCSQCAGQCCYCPEHIKSHEHVVEDLAKN